MTPRRPDSKQVTLLLRRLSAGDRPAAEELLPLVYDELRAIASAVFRRQDPGHTLQPTAVVHEAWLKLAGQDDWEGRRHFFSVAARAMRQVLTDHARRARAEKRGGGRRQVTLDLDEGGAGAGLDLVELDDALAKLGRLSERYVRVFELRFLSGLDTDEIAALLDVTPRTIQLNWRTARAFIVKELGGPA